MTTAPLFVACNARSGSTLLRWLIDAHEDVSCPGETDVAALLAAYIASARAAGLAEERVLREARAVVDDLMSAHLAATGKTRWCDKSLSNVAELDQLAAAWPEARFVLLHRHCMDMTTSALEASEWGLDTYGLAPYAQMSPTNPVVAIVGYWIERTAAMLAFEERHPDRCLRLRYEDLVTSTDESMEAVWRFMGVPARQVSDQAFVAGHDPMAPADYKIWHTGSVHAESVGRGSRIPPERIGGPVCDAMNTLLAQLGYEPVDESWGSGTGLPAPAPAADGLLEVRVTEGHRVLLREIVDGFVVADSLGQGPEASDSGVSCVITTERSALDALCSGTENFGAALRRRTIRRYGDIPARFGTEKQFLDGLSAHLVAAGWGLLARAEPVTSGIAATPERAVNRH